MRPTRRLGRSVLAGTGLLVAGTVALATVPPRPLPDVLALAHALGHRVASEWLAVVALLYLGDRFVRADTAVTRATVRRLAVAVFAVGLAVEVSPLVGLVVDPEPVETAFLAGQVTVAVQGALFPTGLFVATAAGAAANRSALGDRPAATRGLPLAPTDGRVPRIAPSAVVRAGRVLAAVGALSLGLEAATRLAVGAPHVWLVVVDAGVAALGATVDYAVLTVAFLALAVDGVRTRRLVGEVVLVWGLLFLTGVVVAVVGTLLSVLLVSLTTTPMAGVDGTALGRWPEPESWQLLLATGTYLAGAVGLSAIQRTAFRATEPESGASADANDRGDLR